MFAKIPWLFIGRFALIVFCLVIVLAVVVMVLPIYLDITAFSGPLQELLEEVVEAPVTIGEARLHPSPWPTLRIEDLEIAAREEGSAPFAHIDRVELRISLIPLLRDRLKLTRLHLSGASFHAHRPEGRSGNWPVWGAFTLQIQELSGILLEDVTVRLDDHQTTRATLVVDRLTLDIASKRPLDLQLTGSLQDLPVSGSASGPTLAVPRSQASDFPLTIGLQVADLGLDLQGTGSREPRGTRFQFDFELVSQDLSSIERLTEIELPAIGGLQLAGSVTTTPGSLEVSRLQGSLMGSSIRGRLGLSTNNERPLLSGRLALGRIDLDPWLEPSGPNGRSADEPLPFEVIERFDADLDLTIEELVGLDAEIRHLDLRAQIDAGALSLPATLEVGAIPLSTELSIRADLEPPELAGRLAVRSLDLRQLDSLFAVPERLAGTIEALDLGFRTSGSTPRELRAEVALEAEATGSLLRVLGQGEDPPVDIWFDTVRAERTAGASLAINAGGRLFEEDFLLDLSTDPVTQSIQSRTWPFQATLAGAGARISLAGTFEPAASAHELSLDFRAAGERLGDLHSWLGIPQHVDLSYALRGHYDLTGGTRRLRFDDSSIGDTRFTGELARTETESDPYRVNLHAEILDLDDLQQLFEPVTDLDSEERVIGIDLPILPSRVIFHDADIEITADRIPRQTVDLTEVATRFHFRQGQLAPSPFSFRYGSQSFEGRIHLDLRTEVPRFHLQAQGAGDDLGQFLQDEGIAEDLDISARRIELQIDAEGETIRQILRSADLSGELGDVTWTMRPAMLEEPLGMHFDSVDLSGPRGEPIVVRGAGTLEDEPLDFRLTLRVPEEPAHSPGQSLPFVLTSELASTRVALDGALELPVSRGDFRMQASIEGDSVANLSPLFGRQLPNSAPFRIQGQMEIGDEGFALSDLQGTAGESDVRGRLTYARPGGRPQFTAQLESRLLRSVDLFGPAPPEPPPSSTEPGEGPTLPQKIQRTLERLNEIDVRLDLTADRVETAGGSLPDLELLAELSSGRLDLDVRRPETDGKEALLSARIHPTETGLEAAIRATWERQPYGLFGEMLSPGKAQGTWSVDLDLDTRGTSVEELIANLDGYFDFADYPVDFDATIFDLWGGGLLNSILPVFQLGAESRVNCSVGRFDVAQGILTPSSLLLDSTRTRVRGKGTIDLPGDKIRLVLKPRPKQRNLINLSTPIKIQGSLANPSVQLSKGGVAVTFFRLSLWIYTVWRDIARKPLPADGSDLCLDPFGSAKESAPDAVAQ